jgi:MerR family transcriptional regulator/heat shock protein HspR
VTSYAPPPEPGPGRRAACTASRSPKRTDGGTRRYNANDVDRLRRIGDLLEAGLNLAGIAMVLNLETQNAQLRAERKDKP